ncbi:MAG: DNA-binding protein [Janthinobacterium lividum]|nr:DNA-binding protein [Janthinobacterium lividum]
MNLSDEIYKRICIAADTLHVQGGGAAFPTVDAVRKAARVSMNDASAGMREWRRAHTVQANAAAVAVPEKVRDAGMAALAGVWSEAQALAGESLHIAQSAWDAERTESEVLARQMADAYEVLAGELQACQGALDISRAEAQEMAHEKERLLVSLAEAQAAQALANARTQEIERRALELRTELDHAHQDVAHARAELAQTHLNYGNEMNVVRAETAALDLTLSRE